MKAKDIIARLQSHIESGILDPEMPMFPLWATDKLAANIIRERADLATQAGSPDSMIDDALSIANAFDEWPVKRVPGHFQDQQTTI